MWHFFTERGRKAIQLAHREALRLGHDVVRTEHILLAIISEGEGVAVRTLESLGVHLPDLRAHIEGAIGKSHPILKPVDMQLSPRAKRVFDLSVREARNMGVNYVGTEHMLLGILAEGESAAARALLGFGIDHSLMARESPAPRYSAATTLLSVMPVFRPKSTPPIHNRVLSRKVISSAKSMASRP